MEAGALPHHPEALSTPKPAGFAPSHLLPASWGLIRNFIAGRIKVITTEGLSRKTPISHGKLLRFQSSHHNSKYSSRKLPGYLGKIYFHFQQKIRLKSAWVCTQREANLPSFLNQSDLSHLPSATHLGHPHPCGLSSSRCFTFTRKTPDHPIQPSETEGSGTTTD